MTEMAHGALPQAQGEPIFPKWWRTIDHWTLVCVLALFGVGLLLGLAASPPLAERNGLPPFYYVQKQAIFGAMAFVTMLFCSMMDPVQVRRFGVIGFGLAFVALILLPFFGTNFGKGAVR
ncbi:MAG: cell division protein FtsW, partial [Rhodobacteraceae bacterium]|nr:cell division protein FtsW [Paracoccaceae bacterium]